MCIVNHSLFLLRDNVVVIKDLFQGHTKHIFFKQRVHCLMKLKSTVEDENGFKINSYKVAVVCKNGTIGQIIPKNINLMTDWERQPDATQTAMFLNKDNVEHVF